MIGQRSARLLAASFLSCTALSTPGFAQSAPPPRYANSDGTGVDLTTGLVEYSMNEGSIGAGPGAISLDRIWAEGAGWVDNYSGGMYDTTINGQPVTVVQTGGYSDTFTKSGTTFTSQKANGSSIVVDAFGFYIYTASDGTKIKFDDFGIEQVIYHCPGATSGTCRYPQEITRPNGLKYSLAFDVGVICKDLPGEPCYTEKDYVRLQSVRSSAGFNVAFTYASNSIGSPLPNQAWFRRTTATFSSTVSPPSPAPVISYAYPSSGVIDLTDAAGRTWRLTVTTPGLTSVRRPGSTSDDISYVYGSDGKVSSATVNGVGYTYARTATATTTTTTVTDPLTSTRQAVSDIALGRMTSWKDELNRTTSSTYDANGRPTRVTQPEGNYVQLTYDARGNVTEQRQVAKTGSGLADIVATSSYPATCTNAATCNKPTTTTDPRGSVTDYVYDSVHGGVTSVTSPAPTTGAVRPQIRVAYSPVTSASGDIVQLPTSMSQCQTTASCAAAADETLATATYDSRLLTTSTSRKNGTGTLVATQAMTYDSIGNLLTIDGPLAGTGDTTRYRYDAARQLAGTVSPDPDGAGALKNRAIRTTYRSDGLASKQEVGNVNGQTDPDWAAFVTNQSVDLTYDSGHRNLSAAISSGGTTYALIQKSYDALGRTDCTVQRMNSAAFASPPAACTLGTQGTQGPDRIGRTVYDAASEPIQQISALATSDQATEATLTYTANGKTQTLKDGEVNLTTTEYDGFDRLAKTRFPVPAKGANASSTTDYELLGYDANSNAVSRQLRDATSITFTYDKLNRPTLKNLPGTEPDVTYAYDNLGRLTSASQTGQAHSFTYDALSRNLTQVGPLGTETSVWDIAGRRTQLTYPGSGLFVNYDYLVTGEMTKIRENGATSGVGVLSTFAYDDLARRTSLTRGNGTVTSYGFDAVSRLASWAENLTGTANDQSATFSYNPASQIASTTRTNDLYAWTGHGSGTTANVANGLNQLTSIGGAAATYDAKGNLTADPTSGRSYTYSSENLLTLAGGPSSATLAYDPLLRLRQVTGTATTQFAYDGLAMIAEYDGAGALLRRFVHGPGADEPLVQYEGTGTTDRRWLHADERGSLVAISDATGAAITINRYDEYGKPQMTNAGRFGYTGQMWLGEVGLNYYKARIYAPQLGRFLQTDPIGTNGGINLYAYVGNDPSTRNDPTGLNPTAGFPFGYIFKSLIEVDQAARAGSVEYAQALNWAPILGTWLGSLQPGNATQTEIGCGATCFLVTHSHFTGYNNPANEAFSNAKNAYGQENDISTSEGLGVPLWLATPSGAIKAYDPASNAIYTLMSVNSQGNIVGSFSLSSINGYVQNVTTNSNGTYTIHYQSINGGTGSVTVGLVASEECHQTPKGEWVCEKKK